MFSSDILEVATGIIFVFVLLSTICSAVREVIEAWLKTRAAYLEMGIRQLLQDREGTGLVKELFNHPLVCGLFSGKYTPGKLASGPSLWCRGKNLPSYIPSRNFALALMDIAACAPGATAPAQAAPALSLAQMRANIQKIPNPVVQKALLLAIDTGGGDVGRVQANIEAWYDSTMERVSGWYRRSTQWVLFWIALLLTVTLNINTLTIADYLYLHPSLSKATISTIERTTTEEGQTGEGSSSQGSPLSAYEAAQQELVGMHLPVGWANGWGYPLMRPWTAQDHWPGPKAMAEYNQIHPWDDVLEPLIGWLITAFAATLGAPFWFDVLDNIMVVRSTVKPQDKGADAAPVPAQVTAHVMAPQGSDRDLDAQDTCGVGSITPTPDERLPAAVGGVA